MGITIGGILGGLLAGWLAGRAHLRTYQLRALNSVLRQPAGSLEAKANDFTQTAAVKIGQQAVTAVENRMGGSDVGGK